MKLQSLFLVFFALEILNSFGQVTSTNLVNGEIVVVSGNHQRKGVTNTINLPAGKQFVIHGVNIYPYNDTRASFAFVRRVISQGSYFTIFGPTSSWNGPIIGPATLEYGLQQTGTWNGGADSLIQTTGNFLFEIKDDPFQVTNLASASVSSASVVVPADATGDVDVLLEQSTDMITWTQCLPGTYNASTQKRFFRVRAVEK